MIGDSLIRFHAKGNADAEMYLPLSWKGPSVEPIDQALKRIARAAEDACRMIAESGPSTKEDS